MKKNKIYAIIAILAITISGVLVFQACKKGDVKTVTSETIISNIGEHHNTLCKSILKNDYEYFQKSNGALVSTSKLLEWIDICVVELKNDNTINEEELMRQADLAKSFFLVYGDNELGINNFFANIPDESAIRARLQYSGCSKQLEDNIIIVYNNPMGSKDANDPIAAIRALQSDIQRDAFIDVYDHSAELWSELAGTKEIPWGWNEDQWTIFMDALGTIFGLPLGGFGGAILGATFSIGTIEEMKTNH